MQVTVSRHTQIISLEKKKKHKEEEAGDVKNNNNNNNNNKNSLLIHVGHTLFGKGQNNL